MFDLKKDLRIYALVTSCDPLRVFIFNNGLVRMSTEKYEIPNRKNAVCSIRFLKLIETFLLVSSVYAFDKLFSK